MRITEIYKFKKDVFDTSILLSPSEYNPTSEHLLKIAHRASFRRKIVDGLAPHILHLLSPLNRYISNVQFSFHNDVVSIGERFATGNFRKKIEHDFTPNKKDHILVAGCGPGYGEDIWHWLKFGVNKITGNDLRSYPETWTAAKTTAADKFGADLNFKQAFIEKLPFEDSTFDFVTTEAVLEHMQNLDEVLQELARTLKPGALSAHSFGPLYFSYSGDHCIGAYGLEHGYDHILLEEKAYQALIHDQNFFNNQKDKHMNGHAKDGHFSYFKPHEYFPIFEKYYDILYVGVRICDRGLKFKRKYPAKWSQLIEAGLTDEDLLVKSLDMIVRNKK